MPDPIDLREFVVDDLPEVLELMRLSLGETALQPKTSELFRWKHLENPFGRSVILVAVSAGRIVGLRAFMRWELEHGGGTIPCGRAVDTATHPEFRRRGIFRRLTMEALDAAHDAGIRLIFNTPNDRSRPGYLTMGWFEVGKVSVQVRPRPLHLLARHGAAEADPNVIASGAAMVEVDALPRAGIAVVGRNGDAARADDLFTRRSPEFLRWRYTAHPTARYRSFASGGAAVIVRPNNRSGRWELVVSDALGADPTSVFRRAVRTTRAGYAIASFPSGSPARRAGRRSGMVPVPGLAAMTLVARPLDPVDTDVTDPERWRFSLGDLELL